MLVTLGIKGFSFLPKSSLKKVISKEPVKTFLFIDFSKQFFILFAKNIPLGCKPINVELEKSL